MATAVKALASVLKAYVARNALARKLNKIAFEVLAIIKEGG